MFTTPCFIRKNTKELRDKLIELGYNRGTDKWHINDNRKLFAYQYPMKDFDTPYFAVGDSLDLTEDGLLKNKFIDCGENEDLFLAIATLRDDSDFGQLFVMKDGRFEFGIISKVPLGDEFGVDHKATVEELIEHFKNK